MAENEDDKNEYSWESGYEKSWEQINNGETNVLAQMSTLAEKSKKYKHVEKQGRLGMIRNVVLILDYSESMLDKDLKPSRLMCTYKLVGDFIKDFLDGNSIGQLGIIITRNKRAERISELSGNPIKLLKDLEKWNDPNSCKGEASLQNSLEVAFSMLKNLPTYSSREIIMIFGNLTFIDPGNVHDTIQSMKNNGIRCSVIGLSAEMYIYKTLCKLTGGTYSIILDDSHFQQLLSQHVKPHTSSSSLVPSCVKMGFCKTLDPSPSYSSCVCHFKDLTKLNAPGYICPQCKSKCCELPTQCKTCGISLATSSHLVRPIHYLIPLPCFTEPRNLSGSFKCYGCQSSINTKSDKILLCESCNNHYCAGCDEFIHNKLHICPGCAVLRANDLK